MSGKSIRSGDRVTLNYRLSCRGHEIVNTFPEGPEAFVVGNGDIDPRLEFLLSRLVPGERRTWQLEPRQAFGERDESLIHVLPGSEFPSRAELNPGDRVDFHLPNGQTWLGTILAVSEADVKVDFNHPLAGLPLEFEVEIISVE
jgi:FKBP-type peptidyl-prolyl cis-trans isomerase SlpA